MHFMCRLNLWDALERCSIKYFQHPLLPAQQVTTLILAFLLKPWLIIKQSAHVCHLKNNKHLCQLKHADKDSWKLLSTWGVRWLFWVLERRSAAGLGVFEKVEDLSADNAWNPFFSILPAFPCIDWSLGGGWSTKNVKLVPNYKASKHKEVHHLPISGFTDTDKTNV